MLAGALGVDAYHARKRIDSAVLQVVAARLHEARHHLRRCMPTRAR